MIKRTKVSYTEQSNAVVTNITIEYEGDNIPTNDEIMVESQKLFEKASDYSTIKTMQKIRHSIKKL